MRCTDPVSGADGDMPRVKPFKYSYEKEIVMYAYFKKLDYFNTECIYSPFAARGIARDFVKDLEVLRPSGIMDLIHSGEQFAFEPGKDKAVQPRECERCGFISSQVFVKWQSRLKCSRLQCQLMSFVQVVCQACALLERLNQVSYDHKRTHLTIHFHYPGLSEACNSQFNISMQP